MQICKSSVICCESINKIGSVFFSIPNSSIECKLTSFRQKSKNFQFKSSLNVKGYIFKIDR